MNLTIKEMEIILIYQNATYIKIMFQIVTY